jgi:hypothetical protein
MSQGMADPEKELLASVGRSSILISKDYSTGPAGGRRPSLKAPPP